MYVRKEEIVILTMSPDDLRQLADKMEETWRQLDFGDEGYVATLERGNCVKGIPKVVLYLDQQWFHDFERNQKLLNKYSVEDEIKLLKEIFEKADEIVGLYHKGSDLYVEMEHIAGLLIDYKRLKKTL